MCLWCKLHLRQFIVDQAKRHSKNIENQEDYIQEAWLAISLEPHGKKCEYYEAVALRAIQRIYQQDRRYRRKKRKIISTFLEKNR